MWKTFTELKSAKICVLSGKSKIQEEEFKNNLENDHNLFFLHIFVDFLLDLLSTIYLFVTGERPGISSVCRKVSLENLLSMQYEYYNVINVKIIYFSTFMVPTVWQKFCSGRQYKAEGWLCPSCSDPGGVAGDRGSYQPKT